MPIDGSDLVFKLDHVDVEFPVRKGILLRRVIGYNKALQDISLDIRRGETLGLVGESGAGKSLLGRLMLGLLRPTQGRILWEGRDIGRFTDAEFREMKRKVQIVFQNPLSSLNPRMTIGEAIAYPMRMYGLRPGAENRRARVRELLEVVGLDPEHINRYPHEFSGGQRQRIVIARALAAEPLFMVLDEPVSALDVSIQAQILNLILRLQKEFNLTYLLIANSLNVLYHVADRVGVLSRGRLMEVGPTDKVFFSPQSPRTRELLSRSLQVQTPPVASAPAL
jgi:ABC-type oligopeptide transport system ATPase subunit